MKKIIWSLATVTAIIAAASCEKETVVEVEKEVIVVDTVTTETEVETSITVTDDITTDVTWTADKIVNLDGRVFVTEGATLTIEAGTIIKANAGSGANASVLVVTRGSKIEAVGTATQPIVFTSAADNIEIGETDRMTLLFRKPL